MRILRRVASHGFAPIHGLVVDRDQDDIVATFGANLKAARLKLGLTQAQLAEATGLLQQYISLVESGRQNVTLTTAQVLAKAVNRDVRALLAQPRLRSFKS